MKKMKSYEVITMVQNQQLQNEKRIAIEDLKVAAKILEKIEKGVD